MEIERKELHPRNIHRQAYDFTLLMQEYPALKKYVTENKYGNLSINYFDPFAVKALNRALLMHFYDITYWDIPKNTLCPPVPGRADYIHYISDLKDKDGVSYKDKRCKGLDVGVGANCIYPIIGIHEYGWTFVGSDINADSLKNAKKISTCNPSLAHKIELKLQTNPLCKFRNIIGEDDYFDFTICNPPFFSSQKEYEEANQNKTRSLKKGEPVKKAIQNFGGASNELWCEGGEFRFIKDMITESQQFARNVGWFTTLVSDSKELKPLCNILEKVGVSEYKIVNMAQGTKVSRFLAWRFMSRCKLMVAKSRK